jgi:hypothetical protein
VKLTVLGGLGLAILLAACAGEPTRYMQKVDMRTLDPNTKVCTTEHVVGSNRPRRLCMSKADRQHQRDLARELVNNAGGFDQPPGELPTGP